jgi:hypothetical protein
MAAAGTWQAGLMSNIAEAAADGFATLVAAIVTVL